MKKLCIFFLFTVSVTSCRGFAEEISATVENDAIATRAEGSGSTDYYWYKGEKISLTRNEKFVNLVASDGKLTKSLKTEAMANALKPSGQAEYVAP